MLPAVLEASGLSCATWVGLCSLIFAHQTGNAIVNLIIANLFEAEQRFAGIVIRVFNLSRHLGSCRQGMSPGFFNSFSSVVLAAVS